MVKNDKKNIIDFYIHTQILFLQPQFIKENIRNWSEIVFRCAKYVSNLFWTNDICYGLYVPLRVPKDILTAYSRRDLGTYFNLNHFFILLCTSSNHGWKGSEWSDPTSSWELQHRYRFILLMENALCLTKFFLP